MKVTLEKRSGVSLFCCTDPGWSGAPHAFSTRLGGVSSGIWESLNLGGSLGDDPDHVRENFRRFCGAAGTDPARLVKNHQVHGELVRSVSSRDIITDTALPGTFEADGLITDEPDLTLAVFSGDCIPVLLYDPVRHVIGAVHAGWRGTALGTAARAAEKMIHEYGCRGEDILAAVGPGIGPCCFETHADVPEGLRARLGTEADPFIKPAPGKPGKYFADLKGINARWLERTGLLREHIAVCDVCTACRPDLFWSHRKQGLQRGSMAAVIALRPGGAA